MYVAAHHLRTARGVVGVNTFLHLHDATEVKGIGSTIDYDLITQHTPGRLAAVDYQISPGGNTVLSYLDVICPDKTSVDDISAALGHARAALEVKDRPLRRRFSPKIGVQFGAVLSLDAVAERREYDTLSEHVHALILSRTPPPWELLQPLIVEAIRSNDAVTFQLSPQSRSRVETPTPFALPAASISATLDTIDDFEAYHGDLLRAIMPTILGVSLEDAARIGGVRVVAMPSRHVLWEWPRRREGGEVP